jgi:hypothetical protein
MNFAEGERYPVGGVFPEIKKDDLAGVLAQAPFLDGAWTFHGIIMAAKDPNLFKFLGEYANFSLFKFDETTKKNFLDGAARFYMVLRFLEGRRYHFPKISEGTVTSTIHQINQFNDVVISSSNMYPKTKAENERLEKDMRKTEYIGFGLANVHAENPHVAFWLSTQPTAAMMGALHVYVLKRRQIEADQLNKVHFKSRS